MVAYNTGSVAIAGEVVYGISLLSTTLVRLESDVRLIRNCNKP
ncbi:hypothetical protein [Paradesertivirga mongoliensis]|nr:hypothetical protein [Pedobacter mongoliensis]